MTGVGHIGVGSMARARATRFLKRDDIRIVVGWSRGESNLAEYVKLTGAKGARDWREVIEHPAVQAVCVATPTSTHVGFALAALNAGKHVLVECPAVGRLEDFDRMVEAAQRNRVVFYVASNYRLDAQAQAVAFAVPRVGQVLMAQADSSWHPGNRSWYFDRELSGGVFPCVHLYQYTIFHPLGAAREVHACFRGDDKDFGVATAQYASGALGVATGGFQKHGTNDLAVVGTEAMLRRQPDGRFAVLREGEAEPVPQQQIDTTAEDNAAFLRCIRGEMDWRAHARTERAIHAIPIAAQQSAETGQTVRLETEST